MEILVSDKVETVEVFDYIVVAFEKRWLKLFGYSMSFRATIDKSGKLHLVSNQVIPDFQSKARKIRKAFNGPQS